MVGQTIERQALLEVVLARIDVLNAEVKQT
jgi:hypothetical protein